jgi:sugar (pentulose or hexulose) kinase
MTSVIAIFDIGKTNKKFFLFNEQYKIVLERTVQFDETTDEDDDLCENLDELTIWVTHTLHEVLQLKKFDIKAINFSTYGASFVHLDKEGKPVTALYNYLKPFPKTLEEQFYSKYGGETKVSVETASPVLGNLNSGLQLYKLKQEKPELFNKIHCSLHLPQYISYLVTGKCYSDITSIGCHTALWDFEQKAYHEWVAKESVLPKLAPLFASNETMDANVEGKNIKAGVGLHDSSAALIPYLTSFAEPFVLISTGTWCISLNPFNNESLTDEELQQDCLCYMEFHGNPVKASRLFAGHEHEQQTKRLAFHFGVPLDHYKHVAFNAELLDTLQSDNVTALTGVHTSAFAQHSLSEFKNYEQAYHQFIFDIILQQKVSTSLVLGSKKVTRIFVDGGFAKNPVYMNLLAGAFPNMEVFAASVSQATAIGAALAIHKDWNTKQVPADMIDLKYYAANKVSV